VKKCIWRTALVGLTITAAAVSAQQQQEQIEPVSRPPGWSFIPSVAIGTLFDSNLALTSPRADLGETQGDTLFTIQPMGELSMISKRTDFSASYRGTVRRYNDVDALDGYDQRANLSLRRAATKRLTFFVTNTYADVPTTDDTLLNGVPFRRTGSRSNRFAGGAEGRLTKVMTLSGRYDQTWSKFDDTDIALNDGFIHSMQGRLLRHLTPKLAIGADYAFRIADMAEGQRYLTFHDVGGSADWSVGPNTKVSAGAGFSRLNDKRLDQQRSGPYFLGRIDHTTQHVTFGANFARQFVPSFGFGGANRNQELGAYLRAPIGRRMYTNGSFMWRHYLPFEINSLEGDAFWLRSSLGYMVAPWARVEGFYIHTLQDTVVTGGEISRHRVGVQLVLSQPMRIQ
jgi:hypothetical protein